MPFDWEKYAFHRDFWLFLRRWLMATPSCKRGWQTECVSLPASVVENGKGRGCKQRLREPSCQPGSCPHAVCILPPRSFSLAPCPSPVLCRPSLDVWGSHGPLSPISACSSHAFPASLSFLMVRMSALSYQSPLFFLSSRTAVLSAHLQPLQGIATFSLTLTLAAPLT